MTENSWQQALCVLPSTDLHADLAFYTQQLGFQLQSIYPADDPRVAMVSGYGVHLRLDREIKGSPGSLVLLSATEPVEAVPEHSPSGTRILVEVNSAELTTPPTQHKFEVRKLRDAEPWVIGRAGMHYRDLIPSRLGGSIIASHIRIPDGGPVADMVHYHTVGFQLIYCYQGWVRLVYEDQGPPFILRAGDCVTQPPKIRHRVLEASDGLEVIEIGVPAEHITTIDHDMNLPNDVHNPQRLFDDQNFCHHQKDKADWTAHSLPGFVQRDTRIHKTSNGIAGVRVIKPDSSAPTISFRHDGDIYFGFVLQGTLSVGLCDDKDRIDDHNKHSLNAGDAFTIPPNEWTEFSSASVELELLEVSLPGEFELHS